MSCQNKCSEARNGEPCRFCLCQHNDDEYDTTAVSVIAISDFDSGDDNSSSPMLNGG